MVLMGKVYAKCQTPRNEKDFWLGVVTHRNEKVPDTFFPPTPEAFSYMAACQVITHGRIGVITEARRPSKPPAESLYVPDEPLPAT
jgi:hypothetical protein